MAKKGGTYLSKEVVVTPKGNYIIPSLEAFKEQKASDARQHAAEHIQRQKAPNVPIVPSRSPWSIAAAIMGMSDQERIRMFGTADVQTCIYTATSQYKDKYARVSGNKTFRENPERYGFTEVPMDSAQVGDLIQLTDFAGTPHHSTILTDKTKAGDLYVSYSNGHNEPYDVYEGDTTWTMKKNVPVEVFTNTDGLVDGDTPAAFRYQGSPSKQDEWTQEYINKYGLRKEDYFKTPTIPTYTEQPDALRVQKPLIKAEGGFLQPKDAWDRLSIPEKAEMMKVAVRNGITKLQDIRDKYNEFAEGRELEANTFKGGGYKPSDSVKKRISTWEGAAMTGAIDPLSGKWGKNRSFEAEADSFYDALPASIRSQVLSNPELADNLFSYSYNVGAGNFKKRVVPALEKYYTGNGSPEEIANSMWATGDKKLRGLRNRRAVERKGVVDALTPAFIQEPVDNTFVFNPFAIQAENTYTRPIMVPNEDSYVTTHEISPSEQRAQKARETFDAINRFNALMSMLNMDTTAPTYTSDTGNPFLDAIGLLTNSNANGGKIHIKPENRGKFTALKKRTGHSASWFKAHGTPAQKKMAVFALNSRKWKHGLGGNLFDDKGY